MLKTRGLIPILFAATLFSGCTQFSEGGKIEHVHTGLSGFHSGEFDMSAQQAVFVSGDIFTPGDGTYGVVSKVMTPSTKPFGIDKAYSYGSPIHIKAGDVDFNCSGSGCRSSERFTLLLSRTHVERGSIAGLEVKVMGRNGSFLMNIPKEAFQSILSVMAAK